MGVFSGMLSGDENVSNARTVPPDQPAPLPAPVPQAAPVPAPPPPAAVSAPPPPTPPDVPATVPQAPPPPTMTPETESAFGGSPSIPGPLPTAGGKGLLESLPLKLIIWTGVALLLGLGLYLGQVLRPYGTPCSTVDDMLETLASADIAKLRTEERLGFKARAKSEVRSRGRAEYYRVLSLFGKARSLGKKRYWDVRRTIWQLGENVFRSQPPEMQQLIRNKSKNNWLADKAFSSLSVVDQKLVGSAATLLDRTRLEALAFTAGLDSLSADDRALIEGKDLDSEEVQSDPTLSALASRATRSGLSQLTRIASRANRAAKGEFRKLDRREQSRISKSSYTNYVFKSGLSAYKESARSLIKSKDVLIETDSTAADALKTGLGLSSLEAKDRKEIENREEKAFVKGKKAFIKTEGAKLYAKFLQETFTEGCCSVGTVRYLGPSSRSLLRNSTAIVEIDFEGDDEEAKDEEEEEKESLTAEEKKKKEEEEKKVKPKEYLGEVAIVSYVDGTWQKPKFGKMPKHSGQMRKAGGLAGLKDPATIVSVVLMALFALVIVLAVALKRSGPAITCAEGATLALLLAAVQSLIQGQVSLDDILFTPLYMAIPIWIGIRRGAEAGFMAGFLTGLGLTAASALGSVATWAALAGSGLDLSEHLLAAMFLAVTGAVSARLRWPKELPVAVPLLWLLFYVSIDRGLLYSFGFYGHAFLGAAVVGLGLLVRELGLLKYVERVFSD